jgi:endonuclease G
MRHKAAFLLLTLSLLGNLPSAWAICPSVEPYPYPEVVNGPADSTDICHEGFALKHDNSRKAPLWVEYVLTRDHAFGCTPEKCLCLSRLNYFGQDPELKQLKGVGASKQDYKDSEYDRGHNAPAGDMLWGKQVRKESFYFSNMAPQLSALNSGPWRQIEQIVRAWAAQRGALLVVTGPIYDEHQEKLTKKTVGVAVPTKFYKVVYDPATQEVLSLIVPQTEEGRPDFNNLLGTLQDVQQRSGVSPLPGLPIASEATEIWPYDLSSFRTERARRCPKEKKKAVNESK